MAVKTVSLPTLSALSGMYAFVYTVGGVLVNTGGDALSAVSGAAGGKFQFDIAESLTDDYYEVRIYESSTIDPDGLLYYGSLVSGDSQVRDSWPPAALPTEGGGNANDRSLIVYTTIATLTSQTVFTLTAGPTNNDALNDSVAVITSADGTKASRIPVSDYVGSTKEITLSAAPKFTIAPGDFVAVIASGSASGGATEVISEAVVVSRVAIGETAGWQKELIIGDARLSELLTAPKLFIKNIDDEILDGLGSKSFTDPDFVAELRLAPLTTSTRELDSPPSTIVVSSEDDPGILFNDDTPGSEFFELQIPSDKSALGVVRTDYSAQFVMNWGSDTTYETTINLGNIRFVRKNQAAV